jgi:hypothetical protein
MECDACENEINMLVAGVGGILRFARSMSNGL